MNTLMLSILFAIVVCASAEQRELVGALQPNGVSANSMDHALLEVTQACPSGTTLHSPPQSQSSLPSYAQNVQRTNYLSSCGTGKSTCSFCAPSGIYTQEPGTFYIVVHCASPVTAQSWAASATNSIGLAFATRGNATLTVTVSSPVTGYVQYEVCDSSNNYGSWVVPVNAVSSTPAACPSGTTLQTTPQSQSSLPTYARNVQSSLSSCGTGHSTCSFCAPSGIVTKVGSFPIQPRCSSSNVVNYYGGWYPYPSAISASFVPNSINLTGTVSKAGVYGYVTYQLCDTKNQTAIFVVPINVTA